MSTQWASPAADDTRLKQAAACCEPPNHVRPAAGDVRPRGRKPEGSTQPLGSDVWNGVDGERGETSEDRRAPTTSRTNAKIGTPAAKAQPGLWITAPSA